MYLLVIIEVEIEQFGLWREMTTYEIPFPIWTLSLSVETTILLF